MQKLTLVWTFILLIALLDNTFSQVNESNDLIVIPCQSYSVGNKWIYKTAKEKNDGFDVISECTVIENENGRIKVMIKTKSSSNVESKSIINFVADNSAMYMQSAELLNPQVKSITMYLRPEPHCGKVRSKWVDSIRSEQTIGTEVYANMIDPSQNTYKYIGEEEVEVTAGKFKASVFELKKFRIDKNNGGSNYTTIHTSYHVKNIGVVKTVFLMIQKIRKVKDSPNDKNLENEILQGLKDLEEGKDASEIAFLQQEQGKIEYLDGFDVHKTMSTTELVEYSVK